MRILSKEVKFKLLVSLLLNISLDFLSIFTPDPDRGVRRAGGGGGGGGGEEKKRTNNKLNQPSHGVDARI